ncbi:Uncharacterised protein [Serratia fonticola]|nr:Uncharacterised protein [Serratia fonticola]
MWETNAKLAWFIAGIDSSFTQKAKHHVYSPLPLLIAIHELLDVKLTTN